MRKHERLGATNSGVLLVTLGLAIVVGALVYWALRGRHTPTGRPGAGEAAGAVELPVKAVGDFNGDGKRDVVFVDPTTNEIIVRLGADTGYTTAAFRDTVGDGPYFIAVGNFDRGGPSADCDDVVVASVGGNAVYVYSGMKEADPAKFALQPKPNIRIRDPLSISLDAFRDHPGAPPKIDLLLVSDTEPTKIRFYRGDGAGGFTFDGVTDIGGKVLEIWPGEHDGDKGLGVRVFKGDGTREDWKNNGSGTFGRGPSPAQR